MQFLPFCKYHQRFFTSTSTPSNCHKRQPVAHQPTIQTCLQEPLLVSPLCYRFLPVQCNYKHSYLWLRLFTFFYHLKLWLKAVSFNQSCSFLMSRWVSSLLWRDFMYLNVGTPEAVHSQWIASAASHCWPAFAIVMYSWLTSTVLESLTCSFCAPP